MSSSSGEASVSELKARIAELENQVAALNQAPPGGARARIHKMSAEVKDSNPYRYVHYFSVRSQLSWASVTTPLRQLQPPHGPTEDGDRQQLRVDQVIHHRSGWGRRGRLRHRRDAHQVRHWQGTSPFNSCAPAYSGLYVWNLTPSGPVGGN